MRRYRKLDAKERYRRAVLRYRELRERRDDFRLPAPSLAPGWFIKQMRSGPFQERQVYAEWGTEDIGPSGEVVL